MLVEKIEILKTLDGEKLVSDDKLEDEILHADEHKERVYGVMAKLNKALGPTITPPLSVAAKPEHSSPATAPDGSRAELHTETHSSLASPLRQLPIESNFPRSAFHISTVT